MELQLYRKRLIPNETVKLSNDEIVYHSGDIIVTRWQPIRPRKDLGGGESCYLIHLGIKVSRFYDCDGKFIYFYCDIIDTDYNEETNEYVFTDLLADVIVYEDGFVKVLDIEELAFAHENSIITEKQLQSSLRKLASLLDIIYAKRLYEISGEYLDMARKGTPHE